MSSGLRIMAGLRVVIGALATITLLPTILRIAWLTILLIIITFPVHRIPRSMYVPLYSRISVEMVVYMLVESLGVWMVNSGEEDHAAD
jgi:hypothetical protein